jgi:RecA/RadA recombinase
MAKATKVKERASFSELNNLLNKIAPDGEMIELNPIAKIDEWLPTGSYIFNAALSGSLFGGMPNRRSLALAGEEGTGKTYIANSICRNAIRFLGYDIIYCDSEGSIDIEFMTRLGVDTKHVRLQPVHTVEQFSYIAAQITNNFEEMKKKGKIPPKIMVVLDSLGNLSSEKEVEDTTDGSNKRDMTKQQAIRKLFRVNGLKFAMLGIPFIVTLHTYDAMSMFTPKEISGGGGIKYNASIIFMLGKGQLKDKEAEDRVKEKAKEAAKIAKETGTEVKKEKEESKTKLGITVYVNPFKQRFARPIPIQFHIPYYKAPNAFVGLEKYVSWDSCGIVRGRMHTQKEYEKLEDSEKKVSFQWQGWDMVDGVKKPNDKIWVEPRATSKFLVCKHLGGETPLVNLFTDKVFTMEVLKELDSKVIKPTFMLPSIESLEDLAEITEELEEDGDEALEEIIPDEL